MQDHPTVTPGRHLSLRESSFGSTYSMTHGPSPLSWITVSPLAQPAAW
jgi:hypothetical protein